VARRRAKRRALIVFGTRPEAIKIIPVIQAMAENPHFEPIICLTGQHREMLDEVLKVFGITPDFDLNIHTPGQSLADVTTRVLTRITPVIEQLKPDVMVVQGDTTSTFSAALSAFYQAVLIAHVEAGYRTADLGQPFPEEANRRLVGELASWHFAANEGCRQNLIAEGHQDWTINVVGNTGIDALFAVLAKDDGLIEGGVRELLGNGLRTVVMTMHRRENWGVPIESACRAAQQLVKGHPDIQILFAVHLNPLVRRSVQGILGGIERVHLLPALDYLTFSKVLAGAELVMTDSGGVHEEALALGKPLLMLRSVSEWPESVASKATLLVGTDERSILDAAESVLEAIDSGTGLPRSENPLADGHAATRIVAALARYLGATT